MPTGLGNITLQPGLSVFSSHAKPLPEGPLAAISQKCGRADVFGMLFVLNTALDLAACRFGSEPNPNEDGRLVRVLEFWCDEQVVTHWPPCHDDEVRPCVPKK